MARLTSEPIKQYRGTTAQHAAYTGPMGELTVDTDKQVVVVQNGSTAGGVPMARADVAITGDSHVQVNGGVDGTLAGPLAITVDMTQVATDLVSADANNGLSVGADNKLYAKAPDASLVIRSGDNILHDVAGKIGADLSLNYDTLTGKFDIIGHDGATVIATVTVPSSVSMLQSVELVASDPSQAGVEGPFFHFTFLKADGTTDDLYVNANQLEDVYTGQAGVKVEGTVISAVPSQMVSADANNAVKISATDSLFHVATVSTDAGNLATTGADAGALVTKAGITDAVKEIIAESLTDPDASVACDMISATAGNMLTCDNGKLMVVSDYGTM